MNEVADTTQGPFHIRLEFYKGKQKADYVIDNIVDEFSKNACPLTKPKSQGADEVQQIPRDVSGRWLILRNHDFSKLAQARSKKCQKFPSSGAINLKFEVYNSLGVIYSLETIFNKQNKELPPHAKIHVDKNHKENPLESDFLFLRTTDGFLTAIRFFLPDSIYEEALSRIGKKHVEKERDVQEDEDEEELDSSNKENSANSNNNKEKKVKRTKPKKPTKEEQTPPEPSTKPKARKALRRAQSTSSISSQPKEEMEVVKRLSPIPASKITPPKDNNTTSKVKLKNFDLFESTDSFTQEPDLDETTDSIESETVLGKHLRDNDEDTNRSGMVKLIRQTIQETSKRTSPPTDTTRKKTKTQEQSLSPMEEEEQLSQSSKKPELVRKPSFSRNGLKDSNGMESFMDLRISNDAILVDSDNDNNLDKSFHLVYEGSPEEEEEFFSQSFAEAKQQVDDTEEVNMAKLVYNHKELLGSGTFAKVFRGTYSGSLVAVKLFNHFGSASHVKLDETMKSESIIMKTMSHTNVVKWIGANWNTRLILLELCTRGNLFSWIHSTASPARKRTKAVFPDAKQKPWSTMPFVNSVNDKHPLASRFESISIGIAKGLQHIHNNDIIHCDISSMNILLDEKWVPKIADFGVSCMNKKTIPSQSLGAPRWRAPEMYTRSKKKPQHIEDQCSNAVDIFAFGMVLFEMEALSLPFPNKLDPQVEDTVLLGGRPQLPEMHPKLKELIQECWSENPEERPQATDLVEKLLQLNKHS